ncbi:hypothetical protein MIND_01141400 [Mycena indigotica]|uniref:Uncharacterized protein n=1 Tax=Mycena indigotica TaxID=2126181 RepID=A0A8H6S7P1_9AGAR|nr:uncharacterized protein MIND_01141400 [Mycena indigotica]KAF7293621.1 hypothetical protein MIND_01141400 [Mycena indigotica]
MNKLATNVREGFVSPRGLAKLCQIHSPELWDSFNKMRLHQLHHPFRRLLAKLKRMKRLCGHTLELFFVVCRQLLKWIVNSNIRSPPVITRSTPPIPIVLAHHRQLCVERYPDSSITRKLECCPVVERTHD